MVRNILGTSCKAHNLLYLMDKRPSAPIGSLGDDVMSVNIGFPLGFILWVEAVCLLK